MNLDEMTATRTTRWPRMALACLAVVLVTALAADAAVTRLKTLHVTPDVLKPGSMAQGAVELSHPAPPGGVTVKLEWSIRCRGCSWEESKGRPAEVYLPGKVFIPTGKTTGLFTIDVTKVHVPASLIVTATLRNNTQTATVHLLP